MSKFDERKAVANLIQETGHSAATCRRAYRTVNSYAAAKTLILKANDSIELLQEPELTEDEIIELPTRSKIGCGLAVAAITLTFLAPLAYAIYAYTH